ncbi:MAG: hypothetical protein IKX83_00960 [Clostridia bacterium]|nr:hypothetical protein [Clostridia bacterium]
MKHRSLIALLTALLIALSAGAGTGAFAQTADTRPFHEKNAETSSTDTATALVNGVLDLTEPIAEPTFRIVEDFPVPVRSKDGTRPIEGVSLYGILRWDGKDGAVPFRQLKVSKVQDNLPKTVHFRDNNGGFNREYEICLYNGNIYVKHRGVAENWRVAPLPNSMRYRVKAVSVDADEIIALDENNWIYTCIGLFDDTDEWIWNTSWGEVFDIGTGYQLGNGATNQWSLSNVDPQYDMTYTDIDGKLQPVGSAGCTQIFFRDADDATKIYYLDPWLPPDESREIGTPYQSRFKAQSLSSSASVTFIINRYGDMFTRLFDYDLSGSDEVFYAYSWFEQVDAEPAAEYDILNQLTAAKLRLPSPSWVRQPKIPGTVTDRISVESVAPGAENRRLKVEGKQNGHTGYWTKLLNDRSWSFVRTDEPLQGTVLENSPQDTSRKDLAPKTGLHYKGRIAGTGATLKVKDFAYNSHDQKAYVFVGGLRVPATIYMEYGTLGTATTQIITWRPTGFGETLRRYSCALVISEADAKTLASTAEGKQFLETYLTELRDGSWIRPLSLQANIHGLYFADDDQVTTFVRIGAFDLLRCS